MDLGSKRKAMESELFRINTELEKTREGIVDVSQKIDHATAWFRDNVAEMNRYRDAYNAALTSAHIMVLEMPELSELNEELDRVNSFIIDGRGNRARRVNNGGEMQYIRPITQKGSLGGQWRAAVLEFCKDDANRSKYELFQVHCTRANELNVILVTFETQYKKNEKIVKEGSGMEKELFETEKILSEKKGKMRTMFRENAQSGGGHILPSNVSGTGIGDDMRDHGGHGGDMMHQAAGGGYMRDGGGADMGDYDDYEGYDGESDSRWGGGVEGQQYQHSSLSVDNMHRAWGGEDDSRSQTSGGVMVGGTGEGHGRDLGISNHDPMSRPVSSPNHPHAMFGGQTNPSIGMGSRHLHGLVSHDQGVSLINGSLFGIRDNADGIGSSPSSYLAGGFAPAGNLRGAMSHRLHEMVLHNRDATSIGGPSLSGIDRGTSHSIGSLPSYPAGNLQGPLSSPSVNIYDYLPDELGEFLQLMHDRREDPLGSLKAIKMGATAWDSIKDLKTNKYYIHPRTVVGIHAKAWDARFTSIRQKYINRLRHSKS